jgi:competence protein ComEC
MSAASGGGTAAATEIAPGRLMPWLPVAFGTGIAVYFSAEREPVWWVAAALAVAAMTFAVFMRSRAAFPVAVGCAALATGFAVAAVIPPRHQRRRRAGQATGIQTGT